MIRRGMLVSARLRQGMTQYELAQRVHVRQEYISAIERGCKVPSLAVLYRIAEALRLPPAVLLKGGKRQ